MVRRDLAELIKAGKIESVPPDPEDVAALRSQADAHLVSARTIAESDPAGAFSLTYDSIRKELTALLLEYGFRARSAGSHVVTGQAAAILVPGFDVAGFEQLRVIRIATEYGSDKREPASLTEVEFALVYAEDLRRRING